MTRFALTSICLVVGFASSTCADELVAKIDEVLARPEYKQASWGLLVVDANSGKTIYEKSPDTLFAPASTTKLYSCAAALTALGPDHRFTTPVHRRGELKDGILKGDLILVGSGDLTFGGRLGKDGKTHFTSGDHTYANSGLSDAVLTDSNPVHALDELAKQIAKEGINEVQGEVLVDDRLFNRARGTGSGPDLLTSIIVNDNVLDVIITPAAKAGEFAKVQVRPDTALYQVDAQVMTVEAKKPPKLTLLETGPTSFVVRGEIAVDHKPTIRVYYVDPVVYARGLFIEALRRQGIRVPASIHKAARNDLPPWLAYAALPKVASFQSAPFKEAIAVTLKVSHNLYASTLPLLVALKNNERSLEQGLARQGKLLKEMGVPVDTISFAGGAGGAVSDMITPRATISLLQSMAKRPEADAYFDALPVLNIDGTLTNLLPTDSPVVGKVRAKTGTLVYNDLLNDRMLLRSKALAGDLTTAKGTRLFIAMFINNSPSPKDVMPSREGKTLAKLCEIIHVNGP